jgi:hypothetical protein
MGQPRTHWLLSRVRLNALSVVSLLHHRHQRHAHLRQRDVLPEPTRYSRRIPVLPAPVAHRAFAHRRRRVSTSRTRHPATLHRMPTKAQRCPSRRCYERSRTCVITHYFFPHRTHTPPPKHRYWYRSRRIYNHGSHFGAMHSSRPINVHRRQ